MKRRCAMTATLRICPKINLQVRRSNTQAVNFYRSIGFVEDATISMGKRLENPVRK